MKKIILIFILAFVLNFIWEISQSFLYAPHYVGFSGLIITHLIASLGDMLMLAVIWFLDALLFRRVFAKEEQNKLRLMAIVSTGFIMAVLVEKHALATGRWSYNLSMPIIPFLNVGLVPVLQMMFIPAGAAILWSRMKINLEA